MHTAMLQLLLGQTEKAGAAATKVEGQLSDVGADIENKLTDATNFQEFMQGLGELAVQYLVPLAINLLAAIAIFVIGRWVARILTRVVARLLKRANVDETLHKFLLNIVYALMLIVVVIAALGRLGVDTTSFAAIVGAAGLAVGFALKESLGNFAAGVMLVLFKPFQVGNFIEAGGTKGVVEEIHLFNTMLRTPDNIQIVIPNNAIVGGTITNFSAKSTRRIDLEVGCGYGDNLKEVKQFLTDLLAAEPRVLDDPEPVVAVNELADSCVKLVVRPWVNSSDYGATRWDLIETIKNGFDERGFNIPFPTQDIYVHQNS